MHHVPEWVAVVAVVFTGLLAIFIVYWIGYENGHTDASEGRSYKWSSDLPERKDG